MSKVDKKHHPRPQFIREQWTSLDGEWDFAFDDKRAGEESNWNNGIAKEHKILVPFTYETKKSGIHDTTHHEVVWYERKVDINTDKDVLLHFEGVDYHTTLWVNGSMVGHHEGGYHAFKFNITPFISQGENRVVLRVEDSKDSTQPRGKQRWQDENFGCWYVQTTGIWKTVWMEYVSPVYIDNVKMTPMFDEQKIDIELNLNQFTLEDIYAELDIQFDGKCVNQGKVKFDAEKAKITLSVLVGGDPWSMRHWHPENPNLYDIDFKLVKDGEIIDEVQSYFGMRKIHIHGQKILLNNVELYQRLVLDQGYWEDSDLTPPSVEALERDIDLMMELGYNGARKHQKIEDNRFLYLCDKKGFLIWSEFPAAYTFSDKAIERTTKEWMSIVKQHYNHPSIITWTPFNESWGVSEISYRREMQMFTEGIYYLTKAFDQMRPVVSNDGWELTKTDIVTLHDYEELGEVFTPRYEDCDKLMENNYQHNSGRFPLAVGYEYEGQPVIISEFGGIAFNSEEGWGYGNQVNDEEAFMKRFDDIHKAIQDIDYISGFCYTQITDVQQEVNGLLTMDREPKVNVEAIRKINTRRTK